MGKDLAASGEWKMLPTKAMQRTWLRQAAASQALDVWRLMCRIGSSVSASNSLLDPELELMSHQLRLPSGPAWATYNYRPSPRSMDQLYGTLGLLL
jgi:hypothetical protein